MFDPRGLQIEAIPSKILISEISGGSGMSAVLAGVSGTRAVTIAATCGSGSSNFHTSGNADERESDPARSLATGCNGSLVTRKRGNYAPMDSRRNRTGHEGIGTRIRTLAENGVLTAQPCPINTSGSKRKIEELIQYLCTSEEGISNDDPDIASAVSMIIEVEDWPSSKVEIMGAPELVTHTTNSTKTKVSVSENPSPSKKAKWDPSMNVKTEPASQDTSVLVSGTPEPGSMSADLATKPKTGGQ
ncbi:hypothetical protein BDR07DRAFT_1377314 [Suillus spraguei]|nr:hypothetical protein BDR07DRAFT_1377314 [Suillus spraguei]